MSSRAFRFNPTALPSGQFRKDFLSFGKNQKMKIGTYYYPEQWPRDQWERDFDNIAAAGMQIVHLAEFAWFTMEPRAGDFLFDWRADCRQMAAQRKLDVILCPPTAAPPVWLSQEHPQTLPRDQ